MLNKIIIVIVSFYFFIACGAKEETVKKEEFLDTSILNISYKKLDKSMCEFISKIEKSGFDFKSTRELVYYEALKSGATDIYVYKVTTAYTANQNKGDEIKSGEVFLVKAKAYKCKDEDEN